MQEKAQIAWIENYWKNNLYQYDKAFYLAYKIIGMEFLTKVGMPKAQDYATFLFWPEFKTRKTEINNQEYIIFGKSLYGIDNGYYLINPINQFIYKYNHNYYRQDKTLHEITYINSTLSDFLFFGSKFHSLAKRIHIKKFNSRNLENEESVFRTELSQMIYYLESIDRLSFETENSKWNESKLEIELTLDAYQG